MHQNKIRDGDVMVWINIAGEGCETALGHSERHRRHVPEEIRHREEEDVHGRSLAEITPDGAPPRRFRQEPLRAPLKVF